MSEPTFVRFWGTRGSIPTPGYKTRRFGGNTSCVEIRSGETELVCDGGTGLRPPYVFCGFRAEIDQ